MNVAEVGYGAASRRGELDLLATTTTQSAAIHEVGDRERVRRTAVIRYVQGQSACRNSEIIGIVGEIDDRNRLAGTSRGS